MLVLTAEERLVVSITNRAIHAGAVQKGTEFVRLVWLVAQQKPKVVVEIGTGSGGSLLAWCEVADPEATIVSVDMPGGAFGGGYDESLIPMLEGYARPGQTLHLIRGDSHNLETIAAVDALIHPAIDFLFIDGDHTLNGVREDWANYGRRVRRDGKGLVAFHDILPHPAEPTVQVHRVWREIKQTHSVTEFCDPGDPLTQWGGIGVVEL